MKLKHSIITVATAAALLGCGQSEQPKLENKAETPAPGEQAQERQKEVASAPAVPQALADTTIQNAPPVPAPPPAPVEAKPDALSKEIAVITSSKDTTTASSPTLLENKDEFVTAMEKKLKDFDATLDQLAKKAEGYKDEAKTQADQTLAALREQRDKLSQQFETVKAASTDAWKELKTGFETAYADLDKAFENAKTKFN